MFQKALQSTYLFLSSHLLVASSVGACQWNFYFPAGFRDDEAAFVSQPFS